MKKACVFVCLLTHLFIWFSFPLSLYAAEENGLSKGQTVYVPAYSHIYSGKKAKTFLLTVTISIRKIDPKHQIKIATVDYYETKGKLVKKYIEKPFLLLPLESLRYVVPEKDNSGGSGANFIVEWESDSLVNPPIVETIMIGTKSKQGISFTSRGRSIFTSK